MANVAFENAANLHCGEGFMLVSLIFGGLAGFRLAAPAPGFSVLAKVGLLEQTNRGKQKCQRL